MEGILRNNISAIVTGNRQILLKNHAVDSLKDNDVLLKIMSVGICGSDLKYWSYGQCGRFSLNGQEMVIGHEACGQVLQIGPKVSHLSVGDRVAIEPGVPCKNCEHCFGGRYNLCKDMKFCATPPINGNLCRYYVHDADFCYKIPDDLTDEEGAMLEPLSVAVYTCQRANIQLGHNVVIFGAGPIGILCGMVAKSQGASNICTLDIDEHRLDVAKKLGSTDLTYQVNVERKLNPQEVAAELNKLFSNENCVDSCLECSGADSSFVTAMHTTRPGGSVILVGRGSLNVDVPVFQATAKELNIKGIFRYGKNNYAQAMALVSSGAINVKKLITHRLDLMDAQKAFEIASDYKQRSIKVMIKCNK